MLLSGKEALEPRLWALSLVPLVPLLAVPVQRARLAAGASAAPRRMRSRM